MNEFRNELLGFNPGTLTNNVSGMDQRPPEPIGGIVWTIGNHQPGPNWELVGWCMWQDWLHYKWKFNNKNMETNHAVPQLQQPPNNGGAAS